MYVSGQLYMAGYLHYIVLDEIYFENDVRFQCYWSSAY
jgi:hypothetical protein